MAATGAAGGEGFARPPGWSEKLSPVGSGFPTMESEGDPRVLFVMNLVLSAAFASVVVAGLALLDTLEFTWSTVAAATLALTVITWIVVMR